MSKEKAPDWSAVRLYYETSPGCSLLGVARHFAIASSTVSSRAKREGWKRNTRKVVLDRIDACLSGVEPGDDSEKIDGLLTKEAGRRADVVRRHRREWDKVRDMREHARSSLESSLNLYEFQFLEEDKDKREANIASARQRQGFLKEHTGNLKRITEILVAQQNAERKAWGLDEAGGDNDDNPDEHMNELDKAKARVVKKMRAKNE